MTKYLIKLLSDIKSGKFTDTKIHVSGITDADLKNLMDAINAQPEIAAKLKGLSIGCSYITLPPDVTKCTALFHLYMSDNYLLKIPPDVSNCPALQQFYISRTALTMPPDVTKCPALTIFYIDDNQLTIPPDVTNCPALMHFDCGKNRLTIAPDVTKCPALTSFGLNQNELTTPPDVSNCAELKCFNIYDNRLAILPDVSNCPFLKAVVLHNQSTLPKIKKILAAIEKDINLNDAVLCSFDLSDLTVKDFNEISSALKQYPFIRKSLTVQLDRLRDAPVEIWQAYGNMLAQLPKLESLDLHYLLFEPTKNNLLAFGLKLAQSHSLRTIYFNNEYGWEFNQETLQAIGTMLTGCKTLRTLKFILYYEQLPRSIFAAFCSNILCNDNLLDISIRFDGRCANIIDIIQVLSNTLSQLPQLQSLSLDKFLLGSNDAPTKQLFLEALSQRRSLRVLKLSDCELDKLDISHWQIIGNFFEQAHSLQELDFRGNNLSNIEDMDIFREFCSALSKYKSLRILDMSSMGLEWLSLQKYQQLGAALAQCPALHTLVLRSNFDNLVRSQPFENVIELAQCSSLRTLDLSRAYSSPSAPIINLCNTIIRFSSLQTLNLQRNCFKERPFEDLRQLALTLTQCPELLTVDLSHNQLHQLSNDEFKEFCKILTLCPKLRGLYLLDLIELEKSALALTTFPESVIDIKLKFSYHNEKQKVAIYFPIISFVILADFSVEERVRALRRIQNINYESVESKELFSLIEAITTDNQYEGINSNQHMQILNLVNSLANALDVQYASSLKDQSARDEYFSNHHTKSVARKYYLWLHNRAPEEYEYEEYVKIDADEPVQRKASPKPAIS